MFSAIALELIVEANIRSNGSRDIIYDTGK